MHDIVEAALNREGKSASRGEPTGFGQPTAVLIGYGTTGVAIAGQEWDKCHSDSRDVDAEKHLVENRDSIDADSIDADIAVLVGTLGDRRIAEALGETLSKDTTTIVLPIVESEKMRRKLPTITTADNTIPYDLSRLSENDPLYADTRRNQDSEALSDLSYRHVQELATDLMKMLTGEARMSAPIGLYQAMETGGLTQGFLGWKNQIDPETGAQELAGTLVADTLANPFHTGQIGDPENCISFLCGGPDLTLKEAESIRAEAGYQTGADSRLFTADTIPGMESSYRLTILIT